MAGTREKLIGAETSQKHLEERVTDLLKQVQTNEEKLNVYERRPATVNGTSLLNQESQAQSEGQLKAEVAELRYVSNLHLLVCLINVMTAAH